jgi:hypothetical protein
MDTLRKSFDSLEQLIITEGIEIKAVDIHREMDMLLIILNTGFVLKEKLSKYFKLTEVSDAQLHNFRLIGKGIGINWPDLDEDLSLKGFLRSAIKTQIVGEHVA